MASRPRVEVVVDGQAYEDWLEIDVHEPDGGASSVCTVRFGGPTIAVTSTSTLVVRFGYASGAMDTLFDSDRLIRSQYTIEPTKDGLAATWGSRLDLFRKRTVRERELWPSRGRGLRSFLRYVAGKVGYTTVRTNLPDLRLPREVPIEVDAGYWGTLNAMLDHLRPYVLPHDMSSTLYVWWLDRSIAGSAIRLPFGRGEGIGLPKETRSIVNLALLRYQVPPRNDSALSLACAAPGQTFVDGVGEVAGVTSAACSVEVDPSANAELVSRTSQDPAPPPEEGGSEVRAEVRRSVVYAVERDTGGIVRTRVPVRSTVTTWAKDGAFTLGRIQEAVTRYTFVRGTGYRHSAGHRLSVAAMVPLPLAGDEWCGDLYREHEQIVYLVLEDGSLVKWYATKQTWGRVLEPDHVPLYEAVNNRTVDTSPQTYQWTTPARPLTWEVETYLATGGSTKIGRRVYNYLTRRYEGPGEESDAAGVAPSTGEIQPLTVEEAYPDPQYADGQGGFLEPVEGWHAEQVDATWIGLDPVYAGDTSPLYARDWAIAMAEAKFRRSGKRVASYDVTYRKYVSKVHRGRLARTTRRNDLNAHTSIITGARHRAVRERDGGYTVRTSLVARRLEPGTEA